MFRVVTEFLIVNDTTNSSTWLRQGIQVSPGNASVPPMHVDVPANHSGTYFRSRLEAFEGVLVMTLSFAVAGTPPPGFPGLDWGAFPFARTDWEVQSLANITINLPTTLPVNQTAYPAFLLEYGLTESALSSLVVSGRTAHLQLTPGLYVARVTPWNGIPNAFVTASQYLSFIVGDPQAAAENSCDPMCTGGLTCVNGTTCQYVMVHTPNLTSIYMQYVVHTLEAEVEYYDQVADEWLETHNFTAGLNHVPIRILMQVGHQGTYFRSRVNIYIPERYTISLTYTGIPPTGYPVYTWPMFPFVSITAYDTHLATVTVSLPTVNPAANLSVQIGQVHGGSNALSIITSASTVTLTNVTAGDFYFRVLSLTATNSSSSAYTQKAFFHISPFQLPTADPGLVSAGCSACGNGQACVAGTCIYCHTESGAPGGGSCSQSCGNGTVCIGNNTCGYVVTFKSNDTIANLTAPRPDFFFLSYEYLVTSDPPYFAHGNETFIASQPFCYFQAVVNSSEFYRYTITAQFNRSSRIQRETLAVLEVGNEQPGVVYPKWGAYPFSQVSRLDSSNLTATVIRLPDLYPMLTDYLQLVEIRLVHNYMYQQEIVFNVSSNDTMLTLNLTEGVYSIRVRLLSTTVVVNSQYAAEVYFYVPAYSMIAPTPAPVYSNSQASNLPSTASENTSSSPGNTSSSPGNTLSTSTAGQDEPNVVERSRAHHLAHYNRFPWLPFVCALLVIILV
ncbi:uncharacterized protein LOC135821103 isoform X2 [Sycon ciliatum]